MSHGERFDALFEPKSLGTGFASIGLMSQGNKGTSNQINRIVVVEDDPGMGVMLRDFLTLHGYRVDYFSDAQSAVNALRLNPNLYRAVVSDIRMSPLDGLELLKIVARELPRLPVFLFTADSNDLERKAALKLGAASYFVKPFPLSELAAALERRLAS